MTLVSDAITDFEVYCYIVLQKSTPQSSAKKSKHDNSVRLAASNVVGTIMLEGDRRLPSSADNQHNHVFFFIWWPCIYTLVSVG